MAKAKFSQRPSSGVERTSGPSKAHNNPRKKSGNPTSGGKIFGNSRKSKLGK